MFLYCFYGVLKRPNAIGLVLFYPIVVNALELFVYETTTCIAGTSSHNKYIIKTKKALKRQNKWKVCITNYYQNLV